MTRVGIVKIYSSGTSKSVSGKGSTVKIDYTGKVLGAGYIR